MAQISPTFTKTNTEPIQSAQSETLINQINEGASMVTFFGHSGAVDFDFSIGQPGDYHNQGRNPLIMGLGCNSGNIHTSSQGISEDFVLHPEVGALAFLAGSSFGVISSLQATSKAFYENLNKQYGRSIGEVLMNANKDLDRSNLSFFLKSGIQQFTLHGDPAIRFGIAEGPDYIIDNQTVRLSPAVISQLTDSLELNYQIVNLGTNILDSMVVNIKIILADGTEFDVLDRIQAPGSREKLTTNIPIANPLPPGLAKIFIRLDYNNEIKEYPSTTGESNNDFISDEGINYISFLVYSNEAVPLEPENYAIWNYDEPVTLSASTSDLFHPFSKYYIEIDTTGDFNSDFKKTKVLQSRGGIIRWSPELTWQKNQVYYWRISPDTTDSFGNFIWKSSSFLYLPGFDSGWNQSQAQQFRENSLTNIRYNEDFQKMEYVKNVNEIRIKNGVYPQIHPDVIYNNFSNFYLPWHKEADVGVYVVILDPISLTPWENPVPGIYGSWLPWWASDWYVFPYNTNHTKPRYDLINLLDTIIPDNHFVLFYTAQRTTKTYKPKEWIADQDSIGTSIVQILENTGNAKLIQNTIDNPSPYVIFYQKNNLEFTPMEFLVDSGEIIDELIPLPAFWDEGSMISSVIGPSSKWNRIEFDFINLEPTETFELIVNGLSSSGDTSLLYQLDSVQILDISNIDANEYPKLLIQINTIDQVNRTFPELEFLRVFYDGLPDLTINPNNHFVFLDDTLTQGQNLDLQVAIENTQLSSKVDSADVLVTMKNNNNVIIEQQTISVSISETNYGILNWTYEQILLPGSYSLLLEIDPSNQITERFEENNIGILNFSVQAEPIPPLLDVTFDGRHIRSGEIIATKPEIIISVKDPHRYILFDDINNIDFSIIDPQGNSLTIDPSEIRFYPAIDLINNEASLIINKLFDTPAKYFLISEAKTSSGLSSGIYKIDFEIILESTMSNVISFPNPLTSQTRFMAIISGEHIPSSLEIRIYAVTGQLVKSFKMEDLRPYVGTFISDFVWDGRDEKGKFLPNGVYFYDVITKDLTSEFGMNNTNSRMFDRNGLGKIVILR